MMMVMKMNNLGKKLLVCSQSSSGRSQIFVSVLHHITLSSVSSVWSEIQSPSTEDVASVALIIVVGNNDMVLSNDPGQSNIMFVIAFDADGNVLFVKYLTRRKYYHQAGVNKASMRSNKWKQVETKPIYSCGRKKYASFQDCSLDGDQSIDCILWRKF
jgi:hypothetical protein